MKIFLLIMLLCFASSAEAQFYVSPAGSDSNPGTLTSPFKTLNKAKIAMEGSATKTAIIRGGTYSIDVINLTFNSSDAGQTWIPYQNETPVIDGGTTVSFNSNGSVNVTHNGGYILAHGATNLAIKGLTFQNLGDVGSNGEHGMYINGSGYTLRWNTFRNCLYECLTGSSVNSSLIDSNTFDTQYPGNPGNPPNISSAYSMLDFWYNSSNNNITHNLLKNAHAGGISFSDGPTSPANNNNIIDRNLLQNIDTRVGDMGALYMFDESASSTGNQITNNKVFGSGNAVNSTTCIYLDGSVSNVIVKGNICAQSASSNPADEYSVLIHGGKNNTITNNILEAPGLPPFTDIWGRTNQNGGYLSFYQTDTGITDMSGNTFKNNIIFSPGGWPNSLWLVSGSPRNNPIVSTNDYYSMKGSSISNWGVANSNPYYDNPSFGNPLANDYTVGSNSAVYSHIAWQTLPTDQGPLPNPFVTDTTAPSVPTGLAATTMSSSQIKVSWTAATDPDDSASQITYKIDRNSTEIATTSPGATSYSDTGLSPNTAYNYTVSAADPAGNVSPQSRQISATTWSCTSVAIGCLVKTTTSLSVRSKSTGKILCTQPAGTFGKVVGGPRTGGGYTWLNVNYYTGCDGWSIQDYLTASYWTQLNKALR